MSSELFTSRLMEQFDSKAKNTKMLTRVEYNEILEELKSGQKTRRSKKYVIEDISLEDSLLRLKMKQSNKVVVPIEEIFTNIEKVHLKLGHAGRDITAKEVQKIYHNIGIREVLLYINFCKECQLKSAKAKKGIVVKPILEDAFNSRGQLDLIDMQSRPDGEYNFIFNYQDHFTKFVKLRPLKTKQAEEVAENLLDVFMDLGCPAILHTDNGRELKNKLVEKMVSLWPGCTIVHGKPRHSQSQGSVERSNRDVQNKIICWLNEHQTTRWSECLRYVQYEKNICFHRGIGMSPFQALYGDRPTNIIDSLALPPNIIKKLNTDDDLKILAGKIKRSEEGAHSSAGPNTENTGEDERIINNDSTEDCEEPQEFHGFTKEDYTKHIEKIEDLRTIIKKRSSELAQEMLSQCTKRMKVVDIGSTVKIRVPDVDRGRTDHLNVLGIITDARNDLYEIGTKYGTLDHLYSRNQFEICKEKLVTMEEVKKEKINLRNLVGKSSVSRMSQGFVKCTCTTPCMNQQCSCRRRGLQCNSRCHKSNSTCQNK